MYVIFSTLFLLPIRLYGFLRMAKPAGWGTQGTRLRAETGGASSGGVCLGSSFGRGTGRTFANSATGTATLR